MSSVIIRIRQKGYVRSAGYQTVQWAVTVPVSDPITDPLIGTAPLSYAPLFVARNVGGFDSLDRIATLQDFVDLPQAELRLFDIRGPGGDGAFASVLPGDQLVFPDVASAGSMAYWLEDTAPYDTNIFTVKQVTNIASGVSPVSLGGSKLQLNDHTFTPDDVGRWIGVVNVTPPAFYVQILSYTGNVANISSNISAGTGTSWFIPAIEIEPAISPSLEPRFFPTRERNLKWQLVNGATIKASGSSGGRTMREFIGGVEPTLSRSLRFTAVAPSNEAALNLITAVQNGVMNLQRAATVNNTDFTVLITDTYGP